MKRRWKQWLSMFLAVMILMTSGIIPEHIVKANTDGKSDSPSGDYPYYCPFCQYYYKKSEAHLCDVSKTCPNCDGTGIADDLSCSVCNGMGNIIFRETVSPNKYRITFDANGGILDDAALNGVDYIYTSYSLNEIITASKNGCNFLGWSKNKYALVPDAHIFLDRPQTLYAVFSSQSYLITFDSQGALSNGTEYTEVIKGSSMPSIIPPKKEYTVTFYKNADDDSNAVIGSSSLKNEVIFQGYYTAANGSGIKYYNADGSGTKDWDREENITLYAAWKNNGITLPMASRTGYTFQGWSVSPSVDSGIAAGEYYKAVENTNFYAIWSKDIYTIHYDLAGGVVEKANPDSYDVETPTFTLQNPTKEGYDFTGWISSNGEAGQTNVSIPKGSTGNRNYRASWAAKATTNYKVEIYKMDLDGTYPVSASEIKNLTGTTDTKVNAADIAKRYEYSGFTYQYAKVGQAASLATEMTILGNGSAVLKLFYERNQYNFNIGTLAHVNIKGTTEAGDYYQGDSITLKAQPDKGYHWVKWQSSNISLLADNIEKDINIAMPVGAITMTPKVEPDTEIPYKLVIHRETLEGDYSDSSEDIIVKKKGITDEKVNAEIAAASYQYEGFTYCYGKAYDSKSLGARTSDMNIDADGTSELHLYYSRNSYELVIGNYDTDKVTTGNKNADILYGEKVKLKASTLSGYKFSHWDSSNTEIQSDLNTRNASLIMPASDITMTPIAVDITYTIIFEANDSNCNTPENNVRAVAVPEKGEYGYSQEITMPACKRKGFRFLGWSVSKNGTIDYAENTKVSGLSSIDKDIVKLYAQWEENKYSIQFLANDGINTAHNPAGNVTATGTTPSTANFYYTDNIILPNSGFKRTGFSFLGWSAAEGSNAAEYKAGEFVNSLCETSYGIVKLYAAWSEKSYPISFEPGDMYCYGSKDGIAAKVLNEDKMSTARIYYTDGFTMPDCDYIRPGFTFVGWSKDKNASKKTYKDSSYRGELQPGSIISDLDDTERYHYYPVWKENKYSVSFDKNAENSVWTANGMIKNVYYTENWSLDDIPSNIGYELEGYSEDSHATEIQYQELSDMVKLAGKDKDGETKTIYVIWKPKKLRITYESEGIVSKYSQVIQYGQQGVIADEIITGFYNKEKIFLGWSIKRQNGFGTEKDVNYKAGEESNQCFGLIADNNAGNKLHLYAVWALAAEPKIIAQTKNSDLDAEVKPYTAITVSVSAIGLDIKYQWYCKKAGTDASSAAIAIQGATGNIYTIPAEDVIEEKDGMAYYCVITGSSGQTISEPVNIYVYGIPTIPNISVDSVVNDEGWSNQNSYISASGSVIKGNEEQVEYVYSFDKLEWMPYQELLWTENTTSEGKTLYFKAYNRDCPEIESFIAEYTIKKDDKAPVITGIEKLESEKFQFIINAEDAFSGISKYAFISEADYLKDQDWKKESGFTISAGKYKVYVMDNAGNITMQSFTIYENGYVLLSGKSGSYLENGQCYIVGKGIANWDRDMVIDKSKITSIFIENGITEIPDAFLEGFTSLKNITIPDSVVKIGEYTFDGVPEHMIIHASFGSAGEEAAKKHHYTEYTLEIDGKKDDKLLLHYHDIITIPYDEIDVENKTLAGFGIEPGKKDFHKDELVSGLNTEMEGYIKLYPIYTDAYIDMDGILHITGNNTDYLDDIIPDKDAITEIIIESGVTLLPEQIPNEFKNLSSLTLSEGLKDLPKDRFDGMPENSIIYRPWEDASNDKNEEEKPEDNNGENKKPEDNKEENKKPEEEKPNGEKPNGEKPEDNNSNKENNNIENNDIENNHTENNNGMNNSGSSSIGNGIVIGVYSPPIITEDNLELNTNEDSKEIGKETIDKNEDNSSNTMFPVEQEFVTDDKINSNIPEMTDNDYITNSDKYGTLEEAIDNSINDVKEKGINKKTIVVQTNVSSIIIAKGEKCKVKALKNITKWSIKDKKIAQLKKEGKNLILIGKKVGKTVLIGKQKKHRYQYTIQVKKKNDKQIKLEVKEKKKNQKQILTTSGIVVKSVITKKAEGKVTLKLLNAGKKVKWKLSKKETLKAHGNTAVITIGNNKNYTISAKYKGKIYKCQLSSSFI